MRLSMQEAGLQAEARPHISLSWGTENYATKLLGFFVGLRFEKIITAAGH